MVGDEHVFSKLDVEVDDDDKTVTDSFVTAVSLITAFSQFGKKSGWFGYSQGLALSQFVVAVGAYFAKTLL